MAKANSKYIFIFLLILIELFLIFWSIRADGANFLFQQSLILILLVLLGFTVLKGMARGKGWGAASFFFIISTLDALWIWRDHQGALTLVTLLVGIIGFLVSITAIKYAPIKEKAKTKSKRESLEKEIPLEKVSVPRLSLYGKKEKTEKKAKVKPKPKKTKKKTGKSKKSKTKKKQTGKQKTKKKRRSKKTATKKKKSEKKTKKKKRRSKKKTKKK